MLARCSKQELTVVGLIFVTGIILRAGRTDLLAVEHFDEGVYTSSQWYTGDGGYPAKHLYAPPMTSWMIGAASWIPGLERVAPFVPGIVLGSGFVFLMWLAARSWFGIVGGLTVASVVAMNDLHVLLSRMALTDVSAMFWIIASVLSATFAIQRDSIRQMVAAGVLAGLAWWTKYTGWLALAIIVSGSGFWWLLAGRRVLKFSRLVVLNLAACAVGFAVWSPWLWMLQSHGGYASVSANHSGYVQGFDHWQDNMVTHLSYHFRFDSWVAAAALGLGIAIGGAHRWLGLVRFTWNENQITALHAEGLEPLPTRAALMRVWGAALMAALVASVISSFAVLTCLAVGGLAGSFLWPTLAVQQLRGAQNHAPEPEFRAAAWIDPRLGSCIVTAFFLGMVLTTPLYQPFPRLTLPLTTAVWLAAGGGAAWWVEATFNVSRRLVEKRNDRLAGFARGAGSALTVIVIVLVLQAGGAQMPSFWENRTSLRDASRQLGQTILQDVEGSFVRPKQAIHIDDGGIIHPDPPGQQEHNAIQDLLDRVAPAADVTSPLTDPDKVECVVYTFAEPGVLKHLVDAGFTAAPVADLEFPAVVYEGKSLPTYLVLGPNALRTPGMMNAWVEAQYRFQSVSEFYFIPGEVTLLNLFPPVWVNQHPESQIQQLQLYRLMRSIDGQP